ncbi:MAG: glycosyltransferase, partial [Ignavibacteria bacterium]|nr:glycosyltransferase [Ignavibacteria bacterium]
MTKISEIRKKVSILIPARNEAKNIENLINSLKEILYSDFEVFILDDNSTDGTYEKAVKLTENDKQFKIL